MGCGEQIRFRAQPRGELLEVVVIDGSQQLVHYDRFPRVPVGSWMGGQIVDEGASSTPIVDTPAERGVELDAAVEEVRSDGPMAEAAGVEEGLRHGGGIGWAGLRCLEALPDGVVVAQGGGDLEVLRQNSLAR